MNLSSHTVEERRILILASGPFGKAVANRLSVFHSATVRDIGDGTHPSMWPYADLIVLASSHERPRVAEALDRASFTLRVPWFPVHPSATDVRCGPLVIPGRTACHRCFVRRGEQHRKPEHVTEPVTDDRHPTGYPEHHVGIATAMARQTVAEAFAEPDPTRLGGTVRRFDQVSGATSRSSVVAVDRCPRCRDKAMGESGLWRQMRDLSAELNRPAPIHAGDEGGTR